MRYTTITRSRSFKSLFVLLTILVLAASPSLASDRWFHVRVEEGDGANVSVNLPLSLVEMAFEMIPEEISEEVSQDVHVELNDAGFNVEQLRRLWEEVRYGQDATFLTVEEDDHTIQVRKEGDFFIAETIGNSSDTQIDVRFPLQVVDALFSGGEGRLDFAAAIRALADYGEGDMVTVRENDSTVRVWVDSQNESN